MGNCRTFDEDLTAYRSDMGDVGGDNSSVRLGRGKVDGAPRAK